MERVRPASQHTLWRACLREAPAHFASGPSRDSPRHAGDFPMSEALQGGIVCPLPGFLNPSPRRGPNRMVPGPLDIGGNFAVCWVWPSCRVEDQPVSCLMTRITKCSGVCGHGKVGTLAKAEKEAAPCDSPPLSPWGGGAAPASVQPFPHLECFCDKAPSPLHPTS